MAIDTIPPWIKPVDTLGALSAGASAGASAGHLEQNNRFESARLGMEAQRMQQNAALAQAQLDQQAEQHQMEFQARAKLAEQNQLREQQRLNIENAYKNAALGIAQGRLEEVQKAATDKAKTAAMQFQREQAFAHDVANGVPVMEAYRRNPVSPSLLGATERTQVSDKPIHVGDAVVERQPDGTFKEKYRSPHSNKPIKVGKNLVQINEDGTVKLLYGPGEERKDDILGAVAAPASPQQPGILSRIKNVFSPSAPSSPPSPPASESKTAHPKVGEIRFGHRFKGGDPNEQSNWEPVKEGE
jgi:hypothetical protein